MGVMGVVEASISLHPGILDEIDLEVAMRSFLRRLGPYSGSGISTNGISRPKLTFSSPKR